MPVYYSTNYYWTANTSDHGAIPAPPENQKITKIDWVNLTITGCSATWSYALSVTATGGLGGIPNNTRIDIAAIGGIATVPDSYNAVFPGGLTVCGIGSTVNIRGTSIGTSGGAGCLQIGYHYE